MKKKRRLGKQDDQEILLANTSLLEDIDDAPPAGDVADDEVQRSLVTLEIVHKVRPLNFPFYFIVLINSPLLL